MAYRIQYGTVTAFETHHRKKIPRKKLLSIGALLLAILTLLLWPAAGDVVGRIMFPWSEAAASAFEQAFSAGGLGDAITAFCSQVLTEAGV